MSTGGASNTMRADAATMLECFRKAATTAVLNCCLENLVMIVLGNPFATGLCSLAGVAVHRPMQEMILSFAAPAADLRNVRTINQAQNAALDFR